VPAPSAAARQPLEGAADVAVKHLDLQMVRDDAGDAAPLGPRVRRVILTLTGRVQGVGFRYRVISLAAGHPVDGTVRNVRGAQALEIDVQGEAAAVERFIADVLAHPPSLARVDAVARELCDEPRSIQGFRIAATF